MPLLYQLKALFVVRRFRLQGFRADLALIS
jgi:hypothetical protein